MRDLLLYILMGLALSQLSGCSSQQLKQGTYDSLHERQRQQCLEQGRTDCDQYDYDSYDQYQRKIERDKD